MKTRLTRLALATALPLGASGAGIAPPVHPPRLPRGMSLLSFAVAYF
jgi:hypothetical protein